MERSRGRTGFPRLTDPVCRFGYCSTQRRRCGMEHDADVLVPIAEPSVRPAIPMAPVTPVEALELHPWHVRIVDEAHVVARMPVQK